MIKDVYLGLRGAGDYVLKIITADGKTYIYAVNAKDAATTKVTVGKGLQGALLGVRADQHRSGLRPRHHRVQAAGLGPSCLTAGAPGCPPRRARSFSPRSPSRRRGW
jgi:hypothetical protein